MRILAILPALLLASAAAAADMPSCSGCQHCLAPAAVTPAATALAPKGGPLGKIAPSPTAHFVPVSAPVANAGPKGGSAGKIATPVHTGTVQPLLCPACEAREAAAKGPKGGTRGAKDLVTTLALDRARAECAALCAK